MVKNKTKDLIEILLKFITCENTHIAAIIFVLSVGVPMLFSFMLCFDAVLSGG